MLGGRDLCGIAQTGTGKTAAFALPILQRLSAAPQRAAPHTCRALVLSPTRELASQIADSFRAYGAGISISTVVMFGGVPIGPQRQKLARGVDILVATPGRLLDLIDTRSLTLSGVQVLSLDEADRMLDLGFIHALKRIVKSLPRQRQTLLFSATMPRSIAALAEDYLIEPVTVVIAPATTTVQRVEQEVVFVPSDRKRDLLASLLRDPVLTRVLVFTRTNMAPTVSCATWSAPASRRPPFTATNRSRSANALPSRRPRPRCHRHCRPRHRCRRRVARYQFRFAERPGRLCAPRWPNREGRCPRDRDRVLQRRGTILFARHREADPILSPRDPVAPSAFARRPVEPPLKTILPRHGNLAKRQATTLGRAGPVRYPRRPARRRRPARDPVAGSIPPFLRRLSSTGRASIGRRSAPRSRVLSRGSRTIGSRIGSDMCRQDLGANPFVDVCGTSTVIPRIDRMGKRAKVHRIGDFVLFDVLYEDGSRTSNRKVPGSELNEIDGDLPAKTYIEAQDRQIAEFSGTPDPRSNP